MTQPSATVARIPSGVWILGFVSLFMDVSSEIIHSLLPIYLVTMLGASATTVGLIEGAAEATALIVKVFSGVLSDYLGKRKVLAIIGYGLGAITKPVFAMASGIGLFLTARLVDRVGKGIRGAPRDALIADIVEPGMRGAAYGLRQSLDTVGAFMGPLLAIGLMLLWENNFQAVFWFAVTPGFIAVLLLIFGVREPTDPVQQRRHNPISRANLRRLSGNYWQIVAIGAVFTLARFSEAFLLLRGEANGLELAWIPLILVAMNVAYSLSAYPFGKLADRWNHTRLLAMGILTLITADVILAHGETILWCFAGAIVWGLHMGMTHGLLSTLVANTAPENLRGTAFGFFNLVSGGALLLASVLAGILWDTAGPTLTFYVGSGLAGIALIMMVALKTDTNAISQRT